MNESKNLRELSEAEVLANELEDMAQELREGDDLQIGLSETGRRKNHAPVKVTEDVSVWKIAERVIVEAHVQYSVSLDTDDDFRVIENPGWSGEEQTLIEALDDAGISLDDFDGDDSDYDISTE